MEAAGSTVPVGVVHGEREATAAQHGSKVGPNMPALMNAAALPTAAASMAGTASTSTSSASNAIGIASGSSGTTTAQTATAAAMAAMAMGPHNVTQLMEHPPRPMAFDKVLWNYFKY